MSASPPTGLPQHLKGGHTASGPFARWRTTLDSRCELSEATQLATSVDNVCRKQAEGPTVQGTRNHKVQVHTCPKLICHSVAIRFDLPQFPGTKSRDSIPTRCKITRIGLSQLHWFFVGESVGHSQTSCFPGIYTLCIPRSALTTAPFDP